MWGCAGSCKHYLSECEVPPSENNILMAVFLHPAVIHMHLLKLASAVTKNNLFLCT